MKRIRIGKDISMRWEITTDGVAIPLDGRDLTIEIKSPAGIENNIPYRVDGNILIMTYYGYEQKRPGEYSITLWEKKGKPGQNVVDVIRAFELVRTSQEEDDFVGGDLQIESVDLGTENFDILTEGGYRSINIDTLQAEALEDSVNINGKTYSNEPFTITLPKANLDSAGVMSASDVRTLKEHADSIAQIKTSCEENAVDIERVSNVVDTHESRLGGIDAEISSLNTEVSTLQGKVDVNTTIISQINTTLEEHTESINSKITADRIEDGAVTSEKIATTAFDSTLSVSGKIAPADVVGRKLTGLEQENTQLAKEVANTENRVNASQNALEIRVNTEIKDFKDAVTNQVENYKPIVINGNVTNAADEEDITSEDNLLKLKDRSALNGMGYVILRKNKTFAEQVTKDNTIYEIRYDFDLNGKNINIPAKCILKFNGGCIKNGTIIGNNTSIKADIVKIFDNVRGSWNVNTGYPEWFGGVGDGVAEDTDAIQKAVNAFNSVTLTRTYAITTVNIPKYHIVNNNGTVKSNGNGFLLTDSGTLQGGDIKVSDGCVGVTLGQDDGKNYRRSIVKDVKIIGSYVENTYGIKCVSTSPNNYNTFHIIQNVNIYNCYYGIYGNIRSSKINVTLEQTKIGLMLWGGLLDVEVTGQACAHLDDYPYFTYIYGSQCTLKFNVYDIGSSQHPEYHKYVCYSAGDNKIIASDNMLQKVQFSSFNAQTVPIFIGTEHHFIKNPSVTIKSINTDFMEERELFREHKYFAIRRNDSTQEGYLLISFNASQFGYAKLKFLSDDYCFSKVELYKEDTLIRTTDGPNDYLAIYNDFSNFKSTVALNYTLKCYVTSEVRLVSEELYAGFCKEGFNANKEYRNLPSAKSRVCFFSFIVDDNRPQNNEIIVNVTGAHTSSNSNWWSIIHINVYGRYDTGMFYEITPIKSNCDLKCELFRHKYSNNYQIFIFAVETINQGHVSFDIIKNSSSSLSKINEVETAFIKENSGIYTDNDNNTYDLVLSKTLYSKTSGTTRPQLDTNDAGFQFFDKTVNKPIFWTGTKWVDAIGADV